MSVSFNIITKGAANLIPAQDGVYKMEEHVFFRAKKKEVIAILQAIVDKMSVYSDMPSNYTINYAGAKSAIITTSSNEKK
jgi:hypothetical protein